MPQNYKNILDEQCLIFFWTTNL